MSYIVIVREDQQLNIMFEIYHVFISNKNINLSRAERRQYYLPLVVFAIHIFFFLKEVRMQSVAVHPTFDLIVGV